jgi:cytochrome c oxidase subunit 2
MKKAIIPIVLTVVLSVVLILVIESADLTPPLASRQGRSIDTLLRVLFGLAAIIFSLVMSFLLYSVVAFRRRPGDMEDAEPVHGNVPLEIVWTVIPLIIVLALGGYGSAVLIDITRASAEPELVVEVVGFQFVWSFSYPEYGFTSTELVLPVDRSAVFRIRSTDVIHSFWIPEFRIKMDAIPGILNEERVTPSAVGDYTARCSELCGTGHAYMTAPVRVLDEQDFELWVAEQQEAAQQPLVGAEGGQQLVQQYGCIGCHSLDGSALVGPTFQGLFGARRAFEDGTAAIADEAYIGNSILNPGGQILQGFANVMPGNYGEQITEEEITAIVEFIQSLE